MNPDTSRIDGHRVRNLTVAKVTLLGAAMLTVMAGATIAPALPGIQRHFAETLGPDAVFMLPFGLGSLPLAAWVGLDQLSLAELTGLLLTLPGLGVAVCSPVAGLIGDRIGRGPVLAFSAALFVLAGCSGLVLDGMEALLVGRVLLGCAIGGTMTSATGLVADLFHGKARQQYLGMQGAFMSYGGVLFVTAGGALSDLSWRGPFGVYAVALLILPGVWYGLRGCGKVQDSRQEQGALGRMPWVQLAFLYLTAFTAVAGIYIMPTQLPALLQTPGWGADGTITGLVIGGMSAVGGSAALNFGRIRRYLSNPWVLALNVGLTALGVMHVGLAEMHDSVALLVAGLLMFGFGTGVGLSNMNEWLTGIVPASHRGRALGGLTTSAFLGSFASPLFVTPVIEEHGFARGFLTVGIALCVFTCVAVPVGFLLRRHHTRRAFRAAEAARS